MRYAWTNSYSPAATERALDSMANEPVPYKISHLASRIVLPRNLFPAKGSLAMAEAHRSKPKGRCGAWFGIRSLVGTEPMMGEQSWTSTAMREAPLTWGNQVRLNRRLRSASFQQAREIRN